MKDPQESFVINRLRSIKFSLKGIWYVVKTERSVKIQLFVTGIAIILGFIFNISKAEWISQFLAIGLVLVAEAINTALEKIADYVQPNFDKKIGLIKDIGAGAAGIAAIISLIVALIIYLPKILLLF